MAEKRDRTKEELEALLAEQIQFLENSADSYDRGFEGEAKRLAATIRVLLHDTKNSHSLLKQLSLKDLNFWDSALDDHPGNIGSHGGLVSIALGEHDPKYVAMLDDVPFSRWVPFNDWWSTIVFRDGKGLELSRSEIVLTAANQDGGAHVDPGLNEAYARLSKDNAMGFISIGPSGERPMPGPEKAAIRQIAHELLKSLNSEYSKKPDHNTGVLVSGMSIRIDDAPPAIQSTRMARTRKIGRNEPCPCGSGVKFKRCHGSV